MNNSRSLENKKDILATEKKFNNLQKDPYVLSNLSEELKNDKEVVLEAVKQDRELSPEYAKKQIEDENYKYKNGESRIEVANRIKGGTNDIIENNRGKRIYMYTR